MSPHHHAVCLATGCSFEITENDEDWVVRQADRHTYSTMHTVIVREVEEPPC